MSYAQQVVSLQQVGVQQLVLQQVGAKEAGGWQQVVGVQQGLVGWFMGG